MISVVSLLVAAALVSQNGGFEANAQIVNSKHTMDNSLLHPDAVALPKRRFKKFVRIWTPPTKEVTRVAGDRVVLECIAMGNPLPAIYWMKNGETIQDPNDLVNEIVPQTKVGLVQLTSRLIISSATPGEDEYACVVEAGVKRAVATSTVFTIPTENNEEELLNLEKLFLPSKPIITYIYDELFQEMDSAAVLPCRVHSQTEVQVEWQDKNKQPIYENPRMRVLQSGDLLISSLRWSDMGNFTCVARNQYGNDMANTFIYTIKP